MPSDPSVSFLYLSEPDMIEAGVTDMGQCVQTMEEMFRVMARGDYRMAGSNTNSHGSMITFPEDPPFATMPKDGPDRRFMAMPAYLGGPFDIAGVKWYGSNADNRDKGLPRSIHLMLLSDKETGAPLSVMSGNLLSAYRTGAVPGVGARHFAREDSKVLGIVGPGVMNRTSLASLLYARPSIETVKVMGRSEGSTFRFIADARAQYPQLRSVTAVGTIEEAVRGSDIVTVATSGPAGSATYPYIDGSWLTPGAFVSLPANIRLDDDFILGRARNVVDNIGLYQAWSEELPAPRHETIGLLGVYYMDLIERGLMTTSDITDLGDMLEGRAPGRLNDDEIVLYSVGGMPTEDVAWAATVYRNALERGIGTRLPLWDVPALR